MVCVGVAERLSFTPRVMNCLPSVAQTNIFAVGCVASPRVLADGMFGAFICGSGRMKERAAVGGFVEGYEI